MALLYPYLLGGAAQDHRSLFHIPVIMPSSGDYTSSVIPIICAVAFAAWFERKFKHEEADGIQKDEPIIMHHQILYRRNFLDMEAEYARYMEAVAVLQQCNIPRERLSNEKAEIYEQLAQINRDIWAERKKLALCREIQSRLPQMEHDINKVEEHSKEVERDERRRR